MDNWYVLTGGRWDGPMPRARIQSMLRAGQLAGADLVAQEGMAVPVRAADAGFVAHDNADGVIDAGALAGRGVRLGAAALDVLVNIAFQVPAVVLMIAGVATSPSSGEPSWMFILGLLISFVMSVACLSFQAYLVATSGQTVGKRLTKIRIVREESAELPGFARGVGIRMILNTLFAFNPVYGLTNLLFIFTDERQCLHDRLARTRVVRVR